MVKDNNHIEFLQKQEDIAKYLFKEEMNINELIQKHPEFHLTYKTLKAIWRKNYTEDEIRQRGFRIIKNHHQTLIIPKEELYDLVINKKMSDPEIAKIYNSNPQKVFYLRKQNGIQAIKHFERHPSKDLISKEQSIILGLILGDGWLRKSGKSLHANLGVKHSLKQEDYLKWIANELKRWITEKGIAYTNSFDKRTNKRTFSCSFNTVYHPVFTYLHEKFYKDNIKIIDKDYVLEKLDPLAIAIWVMDDGSTDPLSRSTRLYTNSFSKDEVLFLIDVFKRKFNINAKLKESINKLNGKIYPIIRFNRKESHQLAVLIKPFVIPSMSYKIDCCLKDIISDNLFLLNNEINISEENWKFINEKHNIQEIRFTLANTIKENKIEFPYKKITEYEAELDFKMLLNNNYDLLKSGDFQFRHMYKFISTKKYIDQNMIGNISSNYFQQVNRYNSETSNGKSIKEIWDNNPIKLLNGLWRSNYKIINSDKLRKNIIFNTQVPSQFKPSVAKYIYNTYGNQGNVLDFSAGWGDRLAGFYASNCKRYVGIDPNKLVFDKYKEQIEYYEKYINKETNLINMPAEDVSLDEKFDLIFTSPPYFNKEKYSYDETQSWVRYKTLEEWKEKFLYKTINNFWGNLNNNGYLILNIADINNNSKNYKICDDTNDFISKLEGAKYEECIGMKISKRPNSKIESNILCEPLWIWKKSL
jgi:16S rRNA G966 N2-methylase RsmD